jgi:adenylate cyclase
VIGKLPFEFEDLGEKRVKTTRFHAYCVKLTASKSSDDNMLSSQSHGATKAALSKMGRSAIVVLPFTNMSGDPDQEYFADGIAEEITTHLSRFKHLTVIARNTAFQYKGQAVDVREVGTKLGARFVLEGSVRKAGNRLRVTAQFLDSRDGTHIWAETYDRELTADGVFDIQDDLTSRIVGILADTFGVISQAVLGESRERGTHNLDAYDWVLRAQSNYREFSKGTHRQVQKGLEEAVQLDPNYAEAWAWLAATYRDELIYGFNRKPEPLARAESAAKRALTLDPDNAEANVVLAHVFFYRGELDRFKRHAEALLARNRDSADVYSAMGCYLSMAGEIEWGEKVAAHAIELNLHLPGYAHHPRFYVHYMAGRYEDALAIVESTGETSNPTTHVLISAVLGQLGRNGQARAALHRALEMREDDGLVEALTRRWPDLILRNAMFDGLRKAGLDIPDEPAAAD